MKQLIITTLFFFSSGIFAIGQESVDKFPRTISELPGVFQIGEYESFYKNLYAEYPGFLLSETGNNMNAAFEKWLNMIYAMEEHSNTLDFDLNGLKVWLNVFFNEDGSIDFLQFHKKPYSKNIDEKELKAFFNSFINEYKMPITAEGKFNHSGSAGFPTFGKTRLEAKKPNGQ